MANMNLYYLTQLETKVSLLPEQINRNIDDHILQNLKAKIEGKTIGNGIVLKINKLIDYKYGMIDKTNFMGTTVFQVNYECFICSPTKNLELICVVDNDKIKGFVVCSNGPVVIAIHFNNIDPEKFEINENSLVPIKTKKPIKMGDHLKVSVINVKMNLGEPEIVVMAKLINLASKEEIKAFEKDQLIATNSQVNDDQIFI